MKTVSLMILFFGLLLSACSVKPRPILEGVDQCAFCKMTVMDKKYASEIVTNTGKIYVFDDAHCMHAFLSQSMISRDEVQQILLTDFNHPDILLEADQAILFSSEALRTPMNGNVIALSDSNALKALLRSMQGESFSFHDWLPN